MAVHSVATRDELYESEAGEASVFCFDSALASLSIWPALFRFAYESLCF